MKTLKNWTARRSGASITIEGEDEEGAAVKVANIGTIVGGNVDGVPSVIAEAFNGEKHRLA